MTPEIRKWRRNFDHWGALVIVGTGGTFYYAESYLRKVALFSKKVILIDPDYLEPRNLDRQHIGRTPGQAKVDAVAKDWKTRGLQIVPLCSAVEEVLPHHMWDEWCPRDILMVVLPDNDKARHGATQLAEKMLLNKMCLHVAIVVAGNDTAKGQAYWGLADGDGWLYDWRTGHPEVTVGEEHTGERGTEACGQIAEANLMTAACVGWAIRNMTTENSQLCEYWWSLIMGGNVGLETKTPMALDEDPQELDWSPDEDSVIIS